MKENSRTKNAARNITFGLMNNLIQLFFPFLIRSVTIQVLGVEYLGLGSLFASILQVLNLAEMGFSGAIIYNMYKPIAEKDVDTICALLNLYKRIYRIVGSVILIAGLAVLPFLRNFIEGSVPSDINIYVLYLIYLANTVLTYFLFAYKSALLIAHQRNDIVSSVQIVANISQYILQIFTLFVFKNYYLFVGISCFTTIFNNIMVAILAKKRHPQYICSGEISKSQKKDIRKRVTGLIIQKVCVTTRNSLDSIFISSMLGLTVVAMYSNYYVIMAAALGIMSVFTNAIIAGVGNSVATETIEKNHDDMNKFNFIYMWLSGWVTICLACLYQPVMELWVGDEYVFPYGVVVLFCLYFYALKMGDVRAVYVEACGLWYESRFRAILETITNVILNLILGHFFGVYGIIAGTLISLLIINFGYGSSIVYKYYFKGQKLSGYFMRHALMAIVTLAICVVTYFACSVVQFDGFAGLALKGLICIAVPNILYILIYSRTKSFKDASNLIKKVLRRKETNE